MAHLKTTFFLSLLLLGFGNIAKAQQVDIQAVITKTNGNEQVYELSESDRISFPNDEILVITQNGSDIQIPIDEIRKVTFNEVLASAETAVKNIGIFPNPTTNTFTISGINDVQRLKIYSSDGRLVKQENVGCGQRIDISELSQGLYYVNINKLNFKLIKQ